MLLDLMGFTSVAQYLQHKLDSSLAQAKVDLLAASVWLSLGAGLVTPLGGSAAYNHLIQAVTQDGAATDNLTFVWLLLLVYYTTKCGVMSVATGWRALAARSAEPEQLQQLEQLKSQHQRRAYWQLQEQLITYDNRANKCYVGFALASTLLGVLLIMKGGPDNLQMQLETLEQGALSALLMMTWLFWECYFSSIGAVVQLVHVGSAWVSKLQHKQKWQRSDNE
ncbi:hypothetical protein OEZ85_008464 [Tetradesmus obliquus]|uniref:Uncharacterized protein n=1 Tax=Tetradesmus obliquus TaxID=3088 RepID=A0ABY8TJ93_TETOB|nr:hypothetical protein OEZ85_008464 [Tetradesmus obliquus]